MAGESKSTLLLGAAGVLLNRSLLAAGLRRRVDGWRRAAALVLRDEGSTFILSALGLNVWSDAPGSSSRTAEQISAHTAARLAGFLLAEPVCHVAVERGEVEDRPRPAGRPCYTLGFEPWVEGPGRFAWPQEWGGERSVAAPGDAAECMNVIVRISPAARADVWVRVNHAAADGVPVQEMLTRLEDAWGAAEEVIYPDPGEFAAFEAPRPVPGRPDLGTVQAFVDFAPLLAWRKRENAKLAEPMTVSAAMLWCLTRTLGDHPFGTTVEVAAGSGLERGVGVVVARPAEYQRRANGLARYVRDFNRDLERTRRRVSGSCRTLDAAAFLPARMEAAILRHALDHSPGAFGALALTMLKDARIFGAPIAAAGHGRGFIAVGSVGLPTANGGRVGCITVKGPPGVVETYPSAIREAVGWCGRGESAG